MNTQRTARRRATGTIAVLLCISLAAAACSDDTNNASGRTRNAALVGLINGTFTADQGGWVGAGFPLGNWGKCANGWPSLGDPANALTFGTGAATVTQSLTVPNKGSTVTLSASGRVGGNVASTYTFTMADNNEAPSTGALTGMSYTSPTASTLSVTTTAANENVTITIAAVTATSSQTGCIGPVITGASLTIVDPAAAAAAAATTTTIAPVSAATTTTTIAPVVHAECVAPTPCIVGSVDSKGRTVIFYGRADAYAVGIGHDQYNQVPIIAIQMAPNNWNGGTTGDPRLGWDDATALVATYGNSGEQWHLPYYSEQGLMCRIAQGLPASAFDCPNSVFVQPGFGTLYWSADSNPALSTAKAFWMTGAEVFTSYSTAGLFDADAWALQVSQRRSDGSAPMAARLSVRPVRETIIIPIPTVVFVPGTWPPTTPAPPDKIYQLGDIGPGGGTVFYVNPNAPDGSKYLEAMLPYWSCCSDLFGGFRYVNEWNGTDPWSNWAKAMSYRTGHGSYKADWFLPTVEQLRMMFNSTGTAYDVHMDTSQCSDYWSSQHMTSSLGGVTLDMAYVVDDGPANYLQDVTLPYCVRLIRKF